GLTDPVEGFEEGSDNGQEQTGKEPAHYLGVDVVGFAGLPVAIDAQSTEYSGYGSDHQNQVGKTKVPAVYFTGHLIKFTGTGLCRRCCWRYKKKDGSCRP